MNPNQAFASSFFQAVVCASYITDTQLRDAMMAEILHVARAFRTPRVNAPQAEQRQ